MIISELQLTFLASEPVFLNLIVSVYSKVTFGILILYHLLKHFAPVQLG